MPAAAERMSRVDTAWLRMDNDVNLMMIVGVWLLDPAIRYEALAERINDKLLKYGRFRQKVVQDAMGASWVDDDAFELANHVGTKLDECGPVDRIGRSLGYGMPRLEKHGLTALAR